METVAQLKQRKEEQQQNASSNNPWFRFEKGPDRRIIQDQPALTFRFLSELEYIPMSRTHWDMDLNKPVRCNKRINLGKDKQTGKEKVFLNGNCVYCDKRKEYKAAFKPSPKQQFPGRDWDMSCVLVCPVAVLNKDGTQTFKLLALNSKDYLYSVAKGAYKVLSDFTEMKANAAKPSKLTDYWWLLSPQFKLMADEKCTKDDLKAEVEGWLDENGLEFDLQKAAPFDYDEAIVLRDKLNKVDQQVEDYDDEPENGELNYDDENPPF